MPDFGIKQPDFNEKGAFFDKMPLFSIMKNITLLHAQRSRQFWY